MVQPDIHTFVEHCCAIRNGSPNAFYAYVDKFCKEFKTRANGYCPKCGNHSVPSMGEFTGCMVCGWLQFPELYK